MFKKLVVLFLMLTLVGVIFVHESADAKKASKGGAIAQEDLDKMSATVDDLTKKMYGNCLFSPEDNESLIDIKLKLDNQMLVASDPTLAPLYFKIGILLKSRDMKDDAVECFQTILENFSDTALAPKATAQLKAMGVAVAAPGAPGAAGAGATPAQ